MSAVTTEDPLYKRSQVINVPPSIRKPIVALFLFLVSRNGLEWSIGRFKSIKTDFIRTRSGQGISTPWIKHKNNFFCGPLGVLQRWSFRSDRNFDLSIQLLQLYSFYISPCVTRTQSEKFVNAVTEKPSFHPFEFAYQELILRAATQLRLVHRSYPDPVSILYRPVSSTKNEPHPNGKSFPEGELTLECCESFLDYTEFGRDVVSKYPALFGAVMQGTACNISNIFNPITRAFYKMPSGDFNNVVGKIGLIQEPGFKLRAVANPGRVYQQALSSLGDDLYRILQDLPWDCTHNQSFPFIVIQSHLGKGLMAHAVDLSNATDRFPFSLQMNLLYHIYDRKDAIGLFSDLSRANWLTTLTEDRMISWSVGQPLGLYPSFACFALTHGLILYALNEFRHEEKFYVLGDDVVILDDSLHSKYISFLANMGIPYAPSKTLSSSVLTEFGGKIITKSRIIPQLKWRSISDDSFIDLARNIGMSIRALLRPRQQKIFDVIHSIPEFLNGCGLNPRGLPLADRVKMYYDLTDDVDLYSYLLSYNGRLSDMNYESKLLRATHPLLSKRYTLDHPSWFYPRKPSQTFDLKVISLFQGIPLPPIFISKEFPWKSLGSVVYNAYPNERCLQIYSMDSYTTLLDRLERKINKLNH